ncbi:MAG: glycosyltransferase, partial [Planctomycetaceae bacterium]
MNSIELFFWLSPALVAYAYLGYPLVIWLLSRRFADPLTSADPPQHNQDWPTVSLVIAAYREEQVILERIDNALRCDYPADRLEILIGCDGEEDLTGELVRSVDDDRVHLVQFPERRGKASVLNDCVPAARGEIVVLSDANTMFDPQALRRLARHFRDPRVGGVCGKLVLVDPVSG